MAEFKKKVRVRSDTSTSSKGRSNDNTKSFERKSFKDNKLSGKTRPSKPLRGPTAKMTRPEQRAVAKETRLERRTHKDPLFEFIEKAVALSEKSFKKSLSEDERADVIDELWSISRPRLAAFLQKKEGSRIVKSLLRSKNELICDSIFEIVKENIVELCKHRNACYIVKEIYTDSKNDKKIQMLDALSADFRSLLCHSIGAYVIDHLYNEAPNALCRQKIVESLYGDRFSKLDLAKEHRTLADILKENSAQRDRILTSLYKNINTALGKEVFNVSPMLFAIREFLTNNHNSSTTSELVSELAGSIHRFFDNAIGCSVACLVAGLGSAKDRKAILKSLNTIEAPVCDLLLDPTLTPFFIKIISCFDDTKALGAYLIGERTEDQLAVAKKYTGLANNLLGSMKDFNAALITMAIFGQVPKRYLKEQQAKDIYMSDWASLRNLDPVELAAAADKYAADKAAWSQRHPEINIDSLYEAQRTISADDDALRAVMNTDKLKEDFEILKSDPLPEVVAYPGRSKKDDEKRHAELIEQLKPAMEHTLDNLNQLTIKDLVQDDRFLMIFFTASPYLASSLKPLYFEQLLNSNGTEAIFRGNRSWATVKSFSKTTVGGDFLAYGLKHAPKEFTEGRGALYALSYFEYAHESKIKVTDLAIVIKSAAAINNKDKTQAQLLNFIKTKKLA